MSAKGLARGRERSFAALRMTMRALGMTIRALGMAGRMLLKPGCRRERDIYYNKECLFF
jgi:hypothetical protein